MPQLSPTMEAGALTKWHVKEGDSISAGDIIAEIETDKATMEVEAVDEGRVGKLLVAEGTEDIPINAPIAVILQQDEEPGAVNAQPAAAAKPPSANEPVEESVRPQAQEKAPEMEKAPAATSYRPAAPEPETDPEIPEGTKLISQTVRDALRDAMAEEMRRDPDVFLIGEEVGEYQGAYKVSQGLLEEFGPKRVVDTPITEYGFTGLAVGAAFTGLKPIVEFMSFNFSMQAIDHVINSAAKQRYMSGGQVRCPMVFRGPNGAAARVAAQHSQCYASWYAHVPGLKVIAPYSAADAKGLLKAAIREPDPVIFLENEILYGRTFDVPEIDDFVLPIGKAKVARSGRDVTVVSFSIGMAHALQAAEALAEDGIEAEVIDLRSLRPLDFETVLRSVKKTNRCVTVEEGWPFAGIGSEIAALVQEHGFDWLDAPVLRVTGKDVPLPYAANLEKLALPRPDDVVAAVKAVCYR
jgi:pyruvate dehydrogenase E1 component beta subunit